MKINMSLGLLLQFVKENNDIEPDSCSWEVGDLLSGMGFLGSVENENIVIDTKDPAYWYDWKELVEEAIEKDKSILDENKGLTLEQGLVAIQYFLTKRYWEKDNSMLLKDAYKDLKNEYYMNKNNLEASGLWQEWQVAIEVGRKFNRVFKEIGSVNAFFVDVFPGLIVTTPKTKSMLQKILDKFF